MKKKIIIAVMIIILGSVLGFTLISREKNNVVIYRKEILGQGDIQELVSTTGVVNPVTIVEVGSQVSGRISKLHVDFNSHVKEGQVLAEIDPSQIKTRIKQNEANYESAKATLERSRVTSEIAEKKYNRAVELFEKEMISFEEKDDAEAEYLTSKADVQSAKARLQQAKSQLESSQVDLGYTIIKSPINGIVISRNINVGQTVAASFQAPVLFQIANDLSKMQLECSVDEADIGKIEEGQKVWFTVDAFPDENFSGIVTQVRYASEVIQNVVTYTTIVNVDNPETKLRPGMTATVSIVTGEAKDVLLVPNSALRFTPSLPPEEMRAIMAKENPEMSQGGRETRSEGHAGNSENSQLQRGATVFRSRESSPLGSQGRQSPTVWIKDKNGKLKPIRLITGVTDDTYTEVVRGDLKPGQIVITGVESDSRNEDRSRNNLARRSRGMFR